MRAGDKLRSWLWHRLVFLADRISPEDAFRATGLHMHLKKGTGWVLDSKGVQVWYKGSKQYNEHAHDGYDEVPETIGGRTEEESKAAPRLALYWGLMSR